MSGLRRSTPSQHGVRASGIMAFLDALERRSDMDPHGVMVLRHGAVVAEGWWAPFTADRVQLLYSLSKTFLSTAVGFALAEGLFALDDAIADHFPEFRDSLPAASRAIRIRDALAMASGHDADMATIAILQERATTHSKGVRNGRSRAGSLTRSIITPIVTAAKANKVPELEMSAS